MQAIREAPLRYAAALLLLTLVYVVSGKVGLELAHGQVNATLVWPPTGLALGALLLGGYRLWPGVFAGALIVNLWIGTPLAPACGIAVGNTLEALVGFWLLQHVFPFDLGFRRPRDVVVFIGGAALLATAVSATLGVGSLVAFGVAPTESAAATWLTWWLGDAGGAVVLAPVLILTARGAPAWRELLARPEAWLVLSLLLLTGVPAFFAPRAWHWNALFVSNLTIPLVAWAGHRLGHRGAVLAIGVVAGLAVVGTAQGLGPFSVAPTPVPLLLLWAYLTSIAATALTLAATAAERAADAERERRLQERVLNLQRLESLGLLAGSVAHDFNNLVAANLGNCALLKKSLEDPAELEHVEEILLASQRAAELCNNLLSYSGGGARRLAPVRLPDLVEPLPRLLKGVWPAGVELELELPEGAPAPQGDFSELTQVLMNLSLNGAQAEGATRVRVRAGRREFGADDRERVVAPTELELGERAFLEVEDDGSGLAPEVQRRLFDPFFTTKAEGRGLGLAATLGIVSGHGAALLLETELGRGTKLTLVFPAGFEARAPRLTSPPPTSPTASRGLRILLADDAAGVLAVTRLCLERLGHEVSVAKDGEEALEVARKTQAPFGLAVLDVVMPKLNGPDAVPLLREAQPDLPVVFMSGAPHELDADLLNVEFVKKPFEVHELLGAMDRVLEGAPGPC